MIRYTGYTWYKSSGYRNQKTYTYVNLAKISNRPT